MSWTVSGVDALVTKLDIGRYGPDFERFWRQTMNAGERAGQGAAPRRTAFLAGSFSTVVDTSPLPSWGEVRVGAPYAAPVQGGSRPHMPPVQALVGMAGSIDNAWRIARAIAKKGTKARPFIQRAIQAVQSAAQGGVSQLARAIEARFGR